MCGSMADIQSAAAEIRRGNKKTRRTNHSMKIYMVSLLHRATINNVKILGATLDSNLTMEPHTKTLSSSCFYHIRSLKQIRWALDDSMAGSVASSLVSSRLDYVNFILYGTSLKNINRLQRIQHSLARVVTHRCSRALPSATALLKQLHWLPVEWRIRFKLATMTFKALHTGHNTFCVVYDSRKM